MQRLASTLGRLSLATLMSAAGLACGLTAVQRQAALSLSQAAVTVGSFAATTFPKMRQVTIEMNTTDIFGENILARDVVEGGVIEGEVFQIIEHIRQSAGDKVAAVGGIAAGEQAERRLGEPLLAEVRLSHGELIEVGQQR